MWQEDTAGTLISSRVVSVENVIESGLANPLTVAGEPYYCIRVKGVIYRRPLMLCRSAF